MGFKLIPDETNIRFMRYRNGAFVLSAAAVIASIAAFFMIGLNFGIDFTGGAVIEVGPAAGEEFTESDLTDVRDAVSELNLGSVTVSEIGATGDGKAGIVVAVQQQTSVDGMNPKCIPEGTDTSVDLSERAQQFASACVKETLTEVLGEGLETRREDVVGPTVSGELIQAGTTAVILAVIFMLLYIWLRFEWQFSLGAIAALVHDVILTIGMFSVTQLEFNLPIIAALLTIGRLFHE